MFFAYVLYSDSAGKFYIGSTRNVTHRLAVHNRRSVTSTKAFCPWKLVYSESFSTLSEARRRELEIKSWKNPAYMAKTLNLSL
ncbi:MAG: GIY-YIG nuclease family protein [Dehalococcoidales bacterium]|jgi:putative endonuclease